MLRRIHIDLDDDLLEEASRLAPMNTPSELMRRVLEDFIRRHKTSKAPDPAGSRGEILFARNYTDIENR